MKRLFIFLWSLLLFISGAKASFYDFRGTVEVSGGCSGSLIQYSGSNMESHALILTAGHCTSVEPNQTLYKRPSNRSFLLMDSNGGYLGKLFATELIYATSTGTDMAIYKLRRTYKEIVRRFDIEALTLSHNYGEINNKIEIVSAQAGRGFSCEIERIIPTLFEMDGTIFNDSIRYSRPGCSMFGGTSGAPILLSGTRIVIGVHSSGNDNCGPGTQRNCTACEATGNGQKICYQNYHYGQQTNRVYSCLEDDLSFNLGKEGCLLPRF